MHESFNNRLTRLMSEANLTIREAARLAGVSPSTIQNWRSGGRPSGDYNAVRLLAAELGVSMCFLLTGSEDQPNKKPLEVSDVTIGTGRSWSGIYEVSIKELIKDEEI